MVFCFVQNFFSGQHKSQNIYFFCRAKRNFFFQNVTLGYMTNNLNQIIFFFLHQNQNIFFSNIGNQNIFLEKKHNLNPPQVIWSFPKENIKLFTMLYFVIRFVNQLSYLAVHFEHSFSTFQQSFVFNVVYRPHMELCIRNQLLLHADFHSLFTLCITLQVRGGLSAH